MKLLEPLCLRKQTSPGGHVVGLPARAWQCQEQPGNFCRPSSYLAPQPQPLPFPWATQDCRLLLQQDAGGGVAGGLWDAESAECMTSSSLPQEKKNARAGQSLQFPWSPGNSWMLAARNI